MPGLCAYPCGPPSVAGLPARAPGPARPVRIPPTTAHTLAGFRLMHSHQSKATSSAPGRSLLLSGFSLVPLCFCLAAALTGCGGGPGQFTISSETYRGPELAIQSKPPQHVVIMQAPTPGWIFSFDASRPQFGFTDVFLTITRPNPAFVFSQAVVSQEVGTEIGVNEPIVVYARVLAHDTVPDSQAYSRAAASAPKSPGSAPAPR